MTLVSDASDSRDVSPQTVSAGGEFLYRANFARPMLVMTPSSGARLRRERNCVIIFGAQVAAALSQLMSGTSSFSTTLFYHLGIAAHSAIQCARAVSSSPSVRTASVSAFAETRCRCW